MSDIYVYTSKGYKAVEQDDIDEPMPEYDCGNCGVRFCYPDENELKRDCCPDCESTNIIEIDPEDCYIPWDCTGCGAELDIRDLMNGLCPKCWERHDG